MDAEQLAASWRDGAFVVVDDAGETTTRPAAFVYVDDAGVAWVEPSYADPMGAASPAAHRRDGMVEVVAGMVRVTRGDQAAVFVARIPGQDDDVDGGALAWFDQHMADSGTEWAAERERVRQLLG